MLGTSNYEQTTAASLHAFEQAIQLPALELAVVVPTFNERANIGALVNKLNASLQGIGFEIVIVDDDSPDGTSQAAREIAAHQRHVRVIRRIGRRGLASACLEGMLATSAPYIAVIDGDMQHDETVLPTMFRRAVQENLDVVIASRNVEGGSMGAFPASRTRLSNLGMAFSRLVTQVHVSDPMSGFFLVDRRFLESVVYRVSGIGFKILLDLLASSPNPPRVGEVAYTFRMREAGESKLDLTVGLEFFYLLLDKIAGQYIPVRFVLYAMVGAIGVVLHLGTLEALHVSGAASFQSAQLTATGVSMLFNFLLNNLVTYRDRRLRGAQWIYGFLTFAAACSLGAVVNLIVARDLLDRGLPWLAAGFAGLVFSSVWNYGVTSVFTWRRSKIRGGPR